MLTRYLLLSSCLLFIGCTSAYKHLQIIQGDASCLRKLKPKFGSAIYTTQVQILNNYLSGILLIKEMPDSTTRVVFSSELGLSFFDFEFGPNGAFKVHHIIEKMNRKSVISTLRKDFELVLMGSLDSSNTRIYQSNDRLYYAFPKKKGINYYITDLQCQYLLGIEHGSKRKAIVKVVMMDFNNHVPDSIGIEHTNFKFTIGLKRLVR